MTTFPRLVAAACLAVIVGSIVIAMFLPLIAMITNLSGDGDSGPKGKE